ncbi:TPA: type VI secretion system lipoprotein TssJ, partial [Klebsiella pneumoniae]|nr:type VI secretion system lipoprotein TssJ [Klebsiella pneumoniae]
MWKTICLFNPFTGCGLTQTVTDGTVSITKSIFYKKMKTLHL